MENEAEKSKRQIQFVSDFLNTIRMCDKKKTKPHEKQNCKKQDLDYFWLGFTLDIKCYPCVY